MLPELNDVGARTWRRPLLIITIDGPSASGKGTLAKRLARHFGLPHLDTGLIYRALALDLILAGHECDDALRASQMAPRVDPGRHDEEDLRRLEIGEGASVVSAIPEVRAALLALQRDFANRAEGSVLDGRDCGTVIAPHATAKLFVTASSDIRARRRHQDLLRQGLMASFDAVLADIRRRDERDSSRSAAPLAMPDGAVLIDSTDMTIDAMLEAALIGIDAAMLEGARP